AMGQRVHQEHKDHEERDAASDQQAKAAGAPLELGLSWAAAQPLPNLPELSRRAGEHNSRGRRSADYRRSQEYRVVNLGQRAGAGARWNSTGRLLCRERLTRQRRLVDSEISRLEQPCVAWHQVAG